MIVHVTDGTFEKEVLSHNGVVLVDFYATWCAPCKTLSVVLEKFAEDSGIKVVKIDVDENISAPQTYKVRGVPTLLLFRDGKLVGNRSGAMSLLQLQNFIEKSLKGIE